LRGSGGKNGQKNPMGKKKKKKEKKKEKSFGARWHRKEKLPLPSNQQKTVYTGYVGVKKTIRDKTTQQQINGGQKLCQTIQGGHPGGQYNGGRGLMA